MSANATAIDGQLDRLRADRERVEDHLRVLTERKVPACEHDALIARWNSIRERTTAMNACLEKSKSEAAELHGRWQVALATRDALSTRADNYLTAQERAYKAILDHKTKYPHLYETSPTE